MNLKLNNDVRGSTILNRRKKSSTVKEERQRTGRYIAVLVGICLFMLAIYHAWVRRIPVVASLVVPALIMFVYVAWVLFTASRDKHRLQDLEAAHIAALEAENDVPISEISNNTVEISIVPTKEARDNEKYWEEISSALFRKPPKDDVIHFNKPIILINDRPPEDLDLRWMNIVEVVTANEKLKNYQTKKKFKRKFCRRKRYAAFKRSYSIA